MRKYILMVWSLACLLAYCGVSETGETGNRKPGEEKDSLIFPMRINGNAGYLYVDVKGDKGLPIVFAHSFAGSAEHWKNQVLHFQNVHKVVTFDFRGHGRSDSASVAGDIYSPAQMAGDIETVADFMKTDRFILVGHSMGGSAAIAYTARHPEKVAALVLVGTPGKSDQKQAQKIMASLRSPAYQQVMDNYMNKLLAGAQPEVNTLVMQDYHKMSKPISLAVTGAVFDYDPLPALQKYQGPVLLICTPAESSQPQALSRQLNSARVMVIKGASHWVQLDQPGLFNKTLEDFLRANRL